MSDILNIVFGSQTGTAEELAYDIQKLFREKGCDSQIFELDDISMYKLEQINGSKKVRS